MVKRAGGKSGPVGAVRQHSRANWRAFVISGKYNVIVSL